MHKWETKMLLKHYLEQGVSKTGLSRLFGVSRRTIHSWIAAGELERALLAGETGYGPRKPRAHKLDDRKGIIRTRLADFPKLSARRLFEEVQAAGYEGCHSRVRDFVREVRPVETRGPVDRFETPPGHQGQVDFGTFTLPWGRRHARVMVLGHSRLLWLQFYPRQTMDVLIEGLESAFGRFGGVPAELLFDQMRAVVLSDDRLGGGKLLLNAEFVRFAKHWGFVARSCRACRAQTKGKVERPIRHLRENFFHGRGFVNDADLNEQAARWLEGTANIRIHNGTGERPVDRFTRDERNVLGPLAPAPYRRLGKPRGVRSTPRTAPGAVSVERRPLRDYVEMVR